MTTKHCNTCNTDKPISEFSKLSSAKDGLQPRCKKCYSEYSKEYRSKNKEKEAERKRQWRIDNAEHYAEYTKEYNQKYGKDYYWENREKLLQDKKEYYDTHKEELELKAKIYRDKEENKERKRLYDKEYREKTRERNNSRQRELRKKDPFFKTVHSIRTRLGKVLKRNSWNKNSKFAEYIGCTLGELRKHLESRFKNGMTWDNYGEWHLDHKTPLASAKTEEELYKLCHYTNLQPLWAIDNLKKGAKILPLETVA